MKKKANGFELKENGAVERIRTFTVLLPPAPQAGASASSATTAKTLCLHCTAADLGRPFEATATTTELDCPANIYKINQKSKSTFREPNSSTARRLGLRILRGRRLCSRRCRSRRLSRRRPGRRRLRRDWLRRRLGGRGVPIIDNRTALARRAIRSQS